MGAHWRDLQCNVRAREGVPEKVKSKLQFEEWKRVNLVKGWGDQAEGIIRGEKTQLIHGKMCHSCTGNLLSILTMMREEAGKRNYLGFISHIGDVELAVYCSGNH